MATKIKRSLFIGLGGTGMTALLHTKRMFFDTYGEVPPMIGFLGIDTDGDWYKRELVSKFGNVKLEPNEQLPILVNDAAPIYKVNQERFTWIPEENKGALSSMRLGAGQVRTNGRFAFTVNYDSVKSKISDVLNQITAARHVTNPNYELLGDTEVEIHMVFSVAGGTGSGIFLNMAYTIKDIAPGSKLMGYAVLPEVFRAMSQNTMSKVKANGYGAIEDLDWFMHQHIGKEAFELIYLHSSQMATVPPFNSVVFIDNKNANGDTYDHVEKLTEMISLALVTSAGQLSQASASVNDNLEKRIRDGEMDVEGKKAWAAGMGASEIVFRGEDLSDIYALKAANIIINKMLNSTKDADSIANGWIDSPQVNIRENNGFDNVIDYMLEKTPKFSMSTINDIQGADAEVKGYIDSVMPSDDQLKEKSFGLQSRVENQFHALLQQELNKEGGVGTAERIVVALRTQFAIMMKEMRKEREDFLKKEPQVAQAVKATIEDLIEYDKKFWKWRPGSTLDSKKQDVMDQAFQQAITLREIKRRDMAIQFYTFMNNLLDNTEDKLKNTRDKLNNVYRLNATKLAAIQNRITSEHQMFQIDLAQNYVTKISVNEGEININDLINEMPSNIRFDSMADEADTQVQNAIIAYCKNLNEAIKWENMTIDEIFNKMEEQDFTHLVKTALRKSMPLLTFNYQGFSPRQNPIDIYFLGIPSANCRLNKDFLKKQMSGNTDVDQSIIGMKNRIIIYRQLGVIPAYAIASLPSCELDYISCRTDSHIDLNLERHMQREEYSLKPSLAIDDTLDLWVKGLVFGLIKYDGENYYYRDTSAYEAALDDFWIKLSHYRDEAFNTFRSVRSSIKKQYDEFFNTLQRDRGETYIKEIIDDARAHYLDKYSQINMTRSEIGQHGNEAIKKLITDEINYATKQLGQ